MSNTTIIDTLVIGGGQAGLATGYHLTKAGVPFLIVDASERTGDAWRNRWDSLRLFTPNRFNGLPGMSIAGDPWHFPTKDELADYLESYAVHFGLPIEHGVRIDRLERKGEGYLATAGDRVYEANNVVVAMAAYQQPQTPAFANELDSRITQLHAHDYKSPDQLRAGDALVVGLGNSGAEIAKELSNSRQVYVSGEPSAVQPFRPEKMSGRIMMPVVGPVVLSRLLSTSTPMGRRAEKKMKHKAAPLMRVKPKDLVALGVERVGRTTGTADGFPLTEDGSVLDVSNVIWATGYAPPFPWIDVPVFDDYGDVVHERGVTDVAGLYFVALKFQHSVLSDTLLVVGRDARHVVGRLVADDRRLMTTATA